MKTITSGKRKVRTPMAKPSKVMEEDLAKIEKGKVRKKKAASNSAGNRTKLRKRRAENQEKIVKSGKKTVENQEEIVKSRKKRVENQEKIVKLRKKRGIENEAKIVRGVHVDSESDADFFSDPDKLKNLLQPYSRTQLMDFLVRAAVSDDKLFNRIREIADEDTSHRKIFVHGMGWDTTSASLVSVFQRFGEIEDCNVVTNHITGMSKGYGFVLFKTRKGAVKALREPTKKMDSRLISCQLASIGSPASSHAHDNSGRKIYVSNVPATADPMKLRDFFSQFGEIEAGPLGFDGFTGKSRGFALFIYKTVEGMKRALEKPDKVFDGHYLCCKFAGDGKNRVAEQNLGTDHHSTLNPAYGDLVNIPILPSPLDSVHADLIRNPISRSSLGSAYRDLVGNPVSSFVTPRVPIPKPGPLNLYGQVQAEETGYTGSSSSGTPSMADPKFHSFNRPSRSLYESGSPYQASHFTHMGDPGLAYNDGSLTRYT